MSFAIENVPVWKPAKKVQRRKRSTYPMKYTNGHPMFDNSQKHIGERNDCTVRALAIAAEMTYDVAHQMLETSCGRKRGHGAVFMNIMGANPAKLLQSL